MPGSYTYPYPAYYVTTDVVVFTYHESQLRILLVRRAQAPFIGQWALPGGFLRPDEPLEACARRELVEETSLHEFFLEQFTTSGTIGRDPRGRVITVAYLALARWQEGLLKAGTDASEVRWFPLGALPELAFDHAGLVKVARANLEQMLRERPMLLLKLLPAEFSSEEMQRLHQAVLGITEERRAFYRG